MRTYFNEWGYASRVAAGEFMEIVAKERPPGDDAPEMPDGTMSQEVHYFDAKLRRRAIVHRFLQPDGTVGASGRPDPKYLMGDDGTIYALHRKKK